MKLWMGLIRKRLHRWATWAFLVALYCLLVSAVTPSVTANGSDGPKYRTAYACEGSTLNMDCDRGHVINLIRANYGRFSITICNEHGNTEWSVNCMSRRSHRVLHDKCSQRQNCSVPASTKEFGDPCLGTLKYLEAHFQCVPVHPPSHTTRPRPPWMLSTKTTPSSFGGVGDSPPETPNPPFKIDHELFDVGSDVPDEPFKKLGPSSSTTTLRPPPWLITSPSKKSTTTTTTASTKTTSPKSSSVSTTTQEPVSQTHSNKHEDRSTTVVSSKDSAANDEGENEPSTSTPSSKHGQAKFITSFPSTTSWSPFTDAPEKEMTEEISWCPPSSGRGLFWNWTKSGEVAVLPCPGGASGWATRPCAPRGWLSPPDLGECRSVWLTTLLTRTEAQDAVLAIAQDLTQVTESRKLYGGDLTAAGRLLAELTRRMGQDMSNFPDAAQLEALVTELLVKALTTVSNIFVKQRPAWNDLRPSEHRRAITQLLLGLEEAAFFLADNIRHGKTITHAVPGILMRLQVVETRNVAPVRFPSEGDPSPFETLPTPHFRSRSDMDDSESLYMATTTLAPTSAPDLPRDEITLPPEALLENSENGLVTIVFFSYDSLQELLQPDKNFGYVDERSKKNRSKIVNSRVLSASLGAGRHIELSEPVYVTFALSRTVNVSSPSCVFWDYTTSSWSEEGCMIHRFNRSHVTCRCVHLTHFAVLMDLHAPPLAVRHQTALSVITYVGCVISIVGLLLATIVFHAFKGLKSDRTTIHKNLCLCLLLAEALFVGGISRTDQPLLCGIVAGALHYFFLAAFAWMFFEGFQLYVMLVEVFESEKSRARWYYLAAYGFPAVVVAVSAVVDPHSYGTEAVCWLRTDNYFIFAFVGPVLLVLMANSVFLILSLVLMCRHAHNSAVLKNKETSKLAALRSWVRGAVVLMFLLGLTWTFGLLYLDQASVVMAYIFTVLNSLQGLFIFIFHCLQNDKVKKEMKRLSRRYSWMRACLCFSRSHSNPSTSTKTDRRNSHAAPTFNSQPSNSLMEGLSSGRWRRKSSSGSTRNLPSQLASTRSLGDSMEIGRTFHTLQGRSSLAPLSNTNLGTRSMRLGHSSLRNNHHTNSEFEEEKYSFKSCGRDSGHGGSELEESPRTGVTVGKISSLRLNNNNPSGGQSTVERPRLVNPFAAAAALELSPSAPSGLLPDYRMNGADLSSLRYAAAGSLNGSRMAHRNQSPWNHTYTEIVDGMIRSRDPQGTDPVYEEIEKEGRRSEVQVSDMSDEDGRRQNSDISRQSSRSYGDHRPLLPYTLPDQNFPPTSLSVNDPRFQPCLRHPETLTQVPFSDNRIYHGHQHSLPHYQHHQFQHQPQLDHTIVSAGHMLPLSHPNLHAPHCSNQENGLRSPMGSPQYQEALVATSLGYNPVVQPLSEPNLRNWEAVQRHKDLQQLQHLGEMTVAVLNGEQVVCKLKPPLAPIHENTSQATNPIGPTHGPAISTNNERFMSPITHSHC